MLTILITGEPQPGVYGWRCEALGLEGKSRQPLLDGCRDIKAVCDEKTLHGHVTLHWYDLSKPWALRAVVIDAADLTVSEPKGRLKASFIKRSEWWATEKHED